MNKTFILAATALIAIAGYTATAVAADVGVSINVGQPGFYGRIDIGDAPRPRIIYAEPRIIERVTVIEPPIYLHVRPGHARRWSRHCGEYNACGRRVYFVNDNWYNTTYVEHHRQRNGGHKNHDHDNDRGEHHDRGRHSGKGHDKGKGKGHGKGHGKGNHD